MKNIVGFVFVIIISLAVETAHAQAEEGNVTARPKFFEYVGASGEPVDLNSIPVSDDVDFYLILAFAIDRDSENEPTEGNFISYWTDSLTPQAIVQFKQKHKNAKILLSLYGWSLYANGKDNVIEWYEPKNPETWLKNSVDSLTAMLKKYHGDGIDIDYETIATNSSFPTMVGQLITELKRSGAITVATLAPFTLSTKQYVKLFKGYSSVIDYVLYQFYSEASMPADKLVSRYKSLAANSYSYEKIMWGYQTALRRLPFSRLISAVESARQQGYPLLGIMFYSADEGKLTNFVEEKRLQGLLLNQTITNVTANQN